MLTATVRKVIFDFETVDMVNFEWNQELFEAAKFEEGLAEDRDEERGVMILNMLREKMRSR